MSTIQLDADDQQRLRGVVDLAVGATYLGTGQVFRFEQTTETRAISPGADSALTRMYGVTLAGLAPGDYELALLVRDELQSTTVELREPFAVERGVGVSTVPGGQGTIRP